MSKRLFSALVAAMAFAAIPAVAQTPPGADCLRAGNIYGFSGIKGDERALIVTDRANRRFKVTTMYRCAGLDFNFAVGIKTLEQTRLACVSRGDTILSRDISRAGDRCPIASVVPYTREMEAADKAAASQARR
jgi:hypothetical protein